jgi:hypothetical protein
MSALWILYLARGKRMHRLQTWLTVKVEPDLELLEILVSDGRDAGARMIRAQLVESFLWLHLGAEVGAFPEEAAFGVYAEYFLPFFRSLISKSQRAREEMSGNRIYVAHSRESESLILTFPRFARILIEKAMREEGVFSTELCDFSNTRSLISTFQTLLLLTSSLDAERSVQQFIFQLNFVLEKTWSESWLEGCDSEQVMAVNDVRNSPPSAITCAGFLRLWGYAASVRDLFENLDNRRGISREDLFKLRQRVREIQSWRVNLNSAQAAARFDSVRSRIRHGIDEDVRSGTVNSDIAYQVKQSLDDAFAFWFATSPALEPVEA